MVTPTIGSRSSPADPGTGRGRHDITDRGQAWFGARAGAAALVERVDPALQDSLLLLAPFTAVIPTGPMLDHYAELLQQDAAVQSLGPVDLAAALGQAMDVGLAGPHPQLSYLIRARPVLSYLLRRRLLDRPSLRSAADWAHYQLYCELGAKLDGMLVSAGDPQLRTAGHAAIRAEYANFTAALAHGLRAGQPVLAIVGPLEEYLGQARLHGTRRVLLDDAIAAFPQRGPGTGHSELVTLRDLAGRAAMEQHRLADAKAQFEAILQLVDARDNWNLATSAYHQLGLVAHRQRRYGQAEVSFRKALSIKLQFDDQRGAADSFHQLGVLAQDQGRYAEAEAGYRKALGIFVESGDQHGAADTYHQLGILAQDQGQYAEAEAGYRKALGIFLESGDQHGAADTYHQLGTLAQDQGQYAEAEAGYRKALGIFVESGDQHGAADTYQRLGGLAQDQRRYAEAEASYRRALDSKLESGDRHGAALTYYQLGMLAREQQRYAEAEAGYRRALESFLESGDRDSAASTHHQLGAIAREQQQYAQAEASYRKALHIRRESDPRAASGTARQLGNVLAEIGRHGEAASVLLYAATTSRQKSGGWPAEALHMLNRERALIEPDKFAALLDEEVPARLTAELAAAIEAAGDPEDADDPEGSANAAE
jgi:tetratricopeptide (TPR) repeat protein